MLSPNLTAGPVIAGSHFMEEMTMMVDKEGNLYLEAGEELRPLNPLIGAATVPTSFAVCLYWTVVGGILNELVEALYRLHSFIF